MQILKEMRNSNCFYTTYLFFISLFCYKKIITSPTGEIQDVIKGCAYSFVFDPNKLEVISIQLGPIDGRAKTLC
jgi:hypothetical protein